MSSGLSTDDVFRFFRAMTQSTTKKAPLLRGLGIPGHRPEILRNYLGKRRSGNILPVRQVVVNPENQAAQPVDRSGYLTGLTLWYYYGAGIVGSAVENKLQEVKATPDFEQLPLEFVFLFLLVGGHNGEG